MKTTIIRNQLEQHRFPGSMDVEEAPMLSCLEAKTYLRTQHMILRYNPSFAPNHHALRRFAAVKRIISPLDECLQDSGQAYGEYIQSVTAQLRGAP